MSIPDPIPLLFHNLPEQEAREWARKMRTQAIKPMQGLIPYAPFEDHVYKGHMAYLICSDDHMVHPPGQDKFVAVAGIEVTDKLPNGHMPWLEAANETAEKILGLATKIRM